MLVDPDILARARKDGRDAVVEVLSAQYPACYRMAHAISGREDVGNAIVNWVMRASFRAIRGWQDDAAPQRWFRHHNLLTARRAQKWKPGSESDTLIRPDDRADGAYVAFIRALRSLPHQQLEAFLLTHGEKLDVRGTAIGMDCSTTAAANHLVAAEQRLRELAGENYDANLKRMQDAYSQLAPSQDLAMARVSQSARRFLWPRRMLRVFRVSWIVVILGAIAWAIYHWWPEIVSAVTGILNGGDET